MRGSLLLFYSLCSAVASASIEDSNLFLVTAQTTLFLLPFSPLLNDVYYFALYRRFKENRASLPFQTWTHRLSYWTWQLGDFTILSPRSRGRPRRYTNPSIHFSTKFPFNIPPETHQILSKQVRSAEAIHELLRWGFTVRLNYIEAGALSSRHLIHPHHFLILWVLTHDAVIGAIWQALKRKGVGHAVPYRALH